MASAAAVTLPTESVGVDLDQLFKDVMSEGVGFPVARRFGRASRVSGQRTAQRSRDASRSA